MAMEKVQGPSTSLVFLGIEIDTVQQQLRLPQDKLVRLQSVIALDSTQHPTVVSVQIRQSKTDLFRLGVTLYLGITRDIVCPVKSMAAYLGVCSREEGAFFLYHDGSPLTRGRLVIVSRPGSIVTNGLGLIELCWSQLPHWGGHNSCTWWLLKEPFKLKSKINYNKKYLALLSLCLCLSLSADRDSP